jgi:hypothetical protein
VSLTPLDEALIRQSLEEQLQNLLEQLDEKSAMSSKGALDLESENAGLWRKWRRAQTFRVSVSVRSRKRLSTSYAVRSGRANTSAT